MQIGTGFLWDLFLLLFTTSCDVLCSKFSWVWVMLWIFKVVRWTRDRCTKINKNLTVSNGVRASSFKIWTANLAQSLTVGTLTNSWGFIFGVSNWKFCSQSPAGTPKPDIQMRIFLTWDFFYFFFKCFYFCVKNKIKIKTCWIYMNTVFTNWEKYEVGQNYCLVFIIDF